MILRQIKEIYREIFGKKYMAEVVVFRNWLGQPRYHIIGESGTKYKELKIKAEKYISEIVAGRPVQQGKSCRVLVPQDNKEEGLVGKLNIKIDDGIEMPMLIWKEGAKITKRSIFG